MSRRVPIATSSVKTKIYSVQSNKITAKKSIILRMAALFCVPVMKDTISNFKFGVAASSFGGRAAAAAAAAGTRGGGDAHIYICLWRVLL